MKESPNTLVKMKKGPGRPKKSEAIIKDVKRRTKRLFNPEEKIAIVLEGLSYTDFYLEGTYLFTLTHAW